MLGIIPSITQFAQEVKTKKRPSKPIEEEFCIEVDCGGRMGIKDKKTSFQQLKCNSCRVNQSRFANTFFDGAKIEIHIILYLAIMWLAWCAVKQVMTFSKKISNATVCDYYSHFRQLVANMVDESKIKIGGPGIEVEVDESKFAKRKYHRGHRVGSKDWVLGGIEKHTRPNELKKRYFVVIVKDRTRATIEPIFHHYIREGSIVCSDFWKAYDWMGEEGSGYTHRKVFPPPIFYLFCDSPPQLLFPPLNTQVNHSLHYKDPITGTCTNTIEGKWSGLKAATPKKNWGKYLSSYLIQNIWMDQNSPNIWVAFFAALNTVRYIKGGADAADTAEQIALLTLDEQLEEEAEEAQADIENCPPAAACNFVVSTPPSSSGEEEEATPTPGYFTQDSVDEVEECPPRTKSSEEVATAKLVFLTQIPTRMSGNMWERRHLAPVSLSGATLSPARLFAPFAPSACRQL